MTITTASAARLARIAVSTIRTWCRRGLLAAAKLHGRWVISVADLRNLLARLYPSPRPQPADRCRKGAVALAKTGRAARTTVGHHMSAARRLAVLDAHAARFNAGRATAASYLTDVLGASADFVRRFASGFGKAATAAHRARTGNDPQPDCIARVGRRRFVQCFSYDPRDLDEAARTFVRTAGFLAAEQATANTRTLVNA